MSAFYPTQTRYFDPYTSNGPTNCDKLTKVIYPTPKYHLRYNDEPEDILTYPLENVTGIVYDHFNSEDDFFIPTVSEDNVRITISTGMCFIKNTMIQTYESVEIDLNDKDSYFDKDEGIAYDDYIPTQPPTTGSWYHVVIRHNQDVDVDGAKFGLLRVSNRYNFDWSLYCIVCTFKVTFFSGNVLTYTEDVYYDVSNTPTDCPTIEYRRLVHFPRLFRNLVYESTSNPKKMPTIPYVKLKNPRGNELLYAGTTCNVSWDIPIYYEPGELSSIQGIISTDKYRIDLYSSGSWVKNLAYDIPYDQLSWQWNITEDDDSYSYASVYISSMGEKFVSSCSNSLIFVNPKINITSPEAGDEWTVDDTKTISFNALAMDNRLINIDLYKDDVLIENIQDGIFSFDNSNTYVVPAFLDSEMLTNGDFNTAPPASIPTGWLSGYFDSGVTHEQRASGAYEGAYSYYIDTTSTVTNEQSLIQAIYPITASVGEEVFYEFNVAYYLQVGSIQFYIQGGLDKKVIKRYSTTTPGWTTSKIRIQILPGRTYNVFAIAVPIGSSSRVYIDSVSLKKIITGNDFKIRISDHENTEFYKDSEDFTITATAGEF